MPDFLPNHPKVYDGRNKTFFMFGWESLRSSTQVPSIASVFTNRMRTGDFGETTTVVKDPFTGAPFPGNVVPSNRLSPQAVKALQYMPLPNSPGGANAFTNNFNRNAANKRFSGIFPTFRSHVRTPK